MKHVKILIAEDSKDICELYATAFMKAGFTVYTANEGLSAIDKFHSKEPHIVLLDIMMPEVDGYDVLEEIRKKYDRYIPVVMLTNLDISHFERNESLTTVDAYLVKSNFTPSEIVNKTKEVLKLNKII